MKWVIALGILLPIQDEIEGWIQRLGDDLVEVRDEAARQLTAKGRPGIPLVRKILERSSGPGRLAAEQVLKDIDRADAAAVLKDAGHGGLDKLVEVRDEEYARVCPTRPVWVLPTGPTKSGENVQRAVVVGDLEDAKGPARLIRKPEDIVGVVLRKAEDREEAIAAGRAALFVLRATQPKAHTDALIPGPELADTDENWRLPARWKVERRDDGWSLSGIRMFFDHDIQAVSIGFDKGGRLSSIKVEYTGQSCR